MPCIPYDPTNASLLKPGDAESLFVGSRIPLDDLDAICAECSRLAYIGFEREASEEKRLRTYLEYASLSEFQPIVDAETDTNAFLTVLADGRALIAFRGTQPDHAKNILTDLDAGIRPWKPGGEVHGGFADAFDSISHTLAGLLRRYANTKPPIFTGHSLGAALATLATSLRPDAYLVTFGSPRVGDAEFAALFKSVRMSRYVDCCDEIAQLPPMFLDGYVHCSAEIYIDSTGNRRAGMPEDAIHADRRDAAAEYLLKFAWHLLTNVPVRSLADHSPINYVRSFT